MASFSINNLLERSHVIRVGELDLVAPGDPLPVSPHVHEEYETPAKRSRLEIWNVLGMEEG